MKTTNATNYSALIDGELKNFSESRWQSLVEKATKEGKPVPQPEKVQTFVTYEAESAEDFEKLAPTEEVRVNLFNRGASLKQLQEIRDLMEDPDYEVSEAPYDLLATIDSVTERRAATPESKIEKLLGQLPPEALQRVMAKLLETHYVST
jgi:hypothetical protein